MTALTVVATSFIDPSQINMVWVVERATGLTALALLSLSTYLGVVVSAGWRSRRFPEMTTTGLHRSISLMTTVFLVIHIAGTVVDGYVAVPLSSVVVPFTSDYAVLWVGLGTIAFDLLVATMVTSMLRDRVPPRLWRWIHALTYVLWVLATAHALGATYERSLTFFVALAGVLLVVPATLWRFARPRQRATTGAGQEMTP